MCPGVLRMTQQKGETSEMTSNPFVFLDIKIGDVKAGRVIIELFKDVVPRTVENFRALCTGEKINSDGKRLHYKRTYFHKAIPQFSVTGGDITDGDGTGGESIYGKEFEDENFIVKHDEVGIVGMPNKSKANTNTSQFYITTVPCTHLDGINVAFGKVRKGLNIIREIEDLSRQNDVPEVPCMIENCGELKPGDRWNINNNDGTTDVYPPWPEDWDVIEDEPNKFNKRLTHAILKIRESGNFFFKNNNYIDSLVKYKKTLRYIDFLKKSEKYMKNEAIVQNEINIHLNLALVCLRSEKYIETRDSCNHVLKIEPNNVKALYRRGQALIALQDYDQALIDLKKAHQACPKDKFILQHLEKARSLKRRYLSKEKIIFKKMLEGVIFKKK